jgi:hypothetical protein
MGVAARPLADAHEGPPYGISPKPFFEIDLEHYPNCGGELKIIAAIVEAPEIERILTHLGLRAWEPARGRMQHAT